MRAVDPRVSFAELQHWPDDGQRYELYDGEVIVVPMPVPRHQRVAMNIGDVLRDYERASGGLVLAIPVDVVLSEHDVLQPDVIFVRKRRRHLIDMMRPLRVPPDLAIEVLSPSTAARDRGRKMELFARFSVPEYWIVDPIVKTLEIFVNAGRRYERAGVYRERDEVCSPTLPDLLFAASRIFQE